MASRESHITACAILDMLAGSSRINTWQCCCVGQRGSSLAASHVYDEHAITNVSTFSGFFENFTPSQSIFLNTFHFYRCWSVIIVVCFVFRDELVLHLLWWLLLCTRCPSRSVFSQRGQSSERRICLFPCQRGEQLFGHPFTFVYLPYFLFFFLTGWFSKLCACYKKIKYTYKSCN